jgi:hypothetical protein
MIFRRHSGRLNAVLAAGALIATASPAHARREVATSSVAPSDDDARKQQRKDEKARHKAEEKARHQAEDAQKKKDKEQKKADKRERKEREKKEREERKQRRRNGDQPAATSAPKPTARPTPVPAPAPVFTATPGLAPRERLARAVDLLQQGQEGQARAELARLLADQPDSREARALQDSLDTDPQASFGSDSFAYTVGPHDSLITLAIAYFGDSYKFYGLARYNHIAVPANLKPGDTIRIPGRARAPINRRPAREEEHSAPTPVATPQPPRAVATPATPRTDPARAQRLRRAGLERMSAGSIDQAVSLLEGATRLDPGNAAIAADLNRARRIQAVVHRR